MKIDISTHLACSALATFLGICTTADANVLLGDISTSGEAELSKWYGYRQYGEGPGDFAFSNALLRARAAHVPILTVWSSPECHFCDGFAEMLNTPECQAYVASKKILFTYFKSGNATSYTPPCDPASRDAYIYIHQTGVGGYWPHFRLEWQKPDGTVVAQSWSFVTKQSDTSHNFTVEEFRQKIESLLAGYDNEGSLEYSGGSVAVSDVVASRLEAEAGITKTVWVPLRRSVYSMETATNEVLKCVWKGTTNEYGVAWAAGDTDKFVEVAIPAAAQDGDQIEIRVESLSGRLESAGAAIHVVAPKASSQENPLWIGEKTADELAWGEWTMDLDVATQKVATAVAAGTNAFTLALVGGELWCPDCAGMRTNLLEKAEFLDWAASNYIALVLIDVPRNNSTCPTMLSWDESGTGATAVSGAAYLSRKGISPEAAKVIYDRDHELCYSTWNVPYEKCARLWVPTLILLDSDGKPHGKLLGSRSYPNSSFTVATYMRRFDELLALADDAGEWSNNDWSTTEESFAAQGGTWAGTLGAIDGNTGNATNQVVIDVAEVTGFAKNCVIEFTISGDREATLRPDVVTVHDADGAVETSRGPTFSLSDGTSWCVTNRSGGVRLFLSLKGADIDFFSYKREDDSVCRYQVKADMSLLFSESEESLAVETGELALWVSAGEIYRLAGVSLDVSGEAFESLGGGLYRARNSGRANVSVLEAGLLSYQLWKPGEVSFAESEVSVGERDGEATLTVCRTGGSSGSIGVRVSYADGTAASIVEDIENGRYAWAGDVEFHWPEGVSTNQTFTFPVFDRSPRWDGDQTVVFSVAATEGHATVGAASNCVVTIMEQDRRLPGRLELQLTDAAFSSSGVAYARAGDEVEFAVRRVKGADGDASASFEVTAGAGSVSPASATWLHNSSDTLRAFSLKLDDGLSAGDVVLLKVVSSDVPMLNGLDRFMVRILPAEAPSFAVDSVRIEDAVCNVLCETNVAFASAGYVRYEVVRTSGELPEGVSARIDGTVLRIGGAPERIGVFESAWRVDGIGPDGTRTPGGTLRVVVSVGSLDTLCRETTESEVFPNAVTTYYSGFALDEYGALVGTVRLAARSDGSMRMAVESAGGCEELVAAAWTQANHAGVKVDMDGGEMTATVMWNGSLMSGVLRYNDGAGVVEMPLALFADGILPCNIDSGVYTVDFVPTLVGKNGHAYISARVSRSASGSARAVYSGMLPDGRNFSGAASLVGDGADYAFLPIIVRTASGSFRSLLKIYAEASDERTDGRFWTAYNHSVEDAYTCSYWDVPGTDGSSWQMTAGGGFYRAGMNLESICEVSDDFVNGEAVCYAIDMPLKVLESTYSLSELDGVASRRAKVSGGLVRLVPERGNSSGYSFSFNRASGVFSGKFMTMATDNSPVAVQYGGVVLPNWGEACGCGELRPGPFRPFGAGTAYVKGNAGIFGTEVVLTPVHEE